MVIKINIEDNQEDKYEDKYEDNQEEDDQEDKHEESDQDDVAPENVKYIVDENGLLDIESDDEFIDREKLIDLNRLYDEELIEKVLHFHKYTNIQIDNYLDYLREISYKYFTYEERDTISILYKKFKKRYTCKILSRLFVLLDIIEGKDRRKIVAYLLFYVVSKTLQTLKLKDSIPFYKVTYAKMIEFKENESLNFEEFLMFDNREIPKIEKVIDNLILIDNQ